MSARLTNEHVDALMRIETSLIRSQRELERLSGPLPNPRLERLRAGLRADLQSARVNIGELIWAARTASSVQQRMER